MNVLIFIVAIIIAGFQWIGRRFDDLFFWSWRSEVEYALTRAGIQKAVAREVALDCRDYYNGRYLPTMVAQILTDAD